MQNTPSTPLIRFYLIAFLSCLGVNYIVATDSDALLFMILLEIAFVYSLYKIARLKKYSGWFAGFAVLNLAGLAFLFLFPENKK